MAPAEVRDEEGNPQRGVIHDVKQNREALRKLAMAVNDILSRYIDVHDQIIKFSLRKALPIPFIFKPIEYCKHEHELNSLGSELDTVRRQARERSRSEPTQPQGEFAMILDEHSAALSDAIHRLGAISANLCRKSRGARDYHWAVYRSDIDAYKDAVERYVECGQRLNLSYAQLFGRESA